VNLPKNQSIDLLPKRTSWSVALLGHAPKSSDCMGWKFAIPYQVINFYQVLPLNIRVKITFGQHYSVALLNGTSKVASYVCVVHWSRKNLEQAQKAAASPTSCQHCIPLPNPTITYNCLYSPPSAATGIFVLQPSPSTSKCHKKNSYMCTYQVFTTLWLHCQIVVTFAYQGTIQRTS
jgi:hypothetical protein